MTPPTTGAEVSYQDIVDARARISALIHQTPVLQSELLNQYCGAELFFKCENFQKAGAFKFRGAVNAVFGLNARDAARGVATHSSGNHGSALAKAASLRHIPAYIVVPENASKVKKAAIEAYGGVIIECEANLEARVRGLEKAVKETGASFIPPYDDERIIAGQGTAALELHEQVDRLDVLVTPVGGGGLIAGSAIVANHNGTTIYGAEPEGADDAWRSFNSGNRVLSHHPNSIADGLLTTLGERNFEIILKFVKDILLVSETEIKDAMRLLWSRLKVVVEPSAAVTLAAVSRNHELFAGRRVGLILSGGNVDLDALPFYN